jgi:hypothetical protein
MRTALVMLSCCAALACGCADNKQLGDGQPFRLRGGQFMRGALPGTPPAHDGSGSAGAGAGADGGMPAERRITLVTVKNLVVRQGQGEKAISGLASPDTSAVAIALKGVGDGYWLVPTGVPDMSTSDGELTWKMSADFGAISTGNHELRIVAIDGHGHAGAQVAQKLCVVGTVPDNLHACDPSNPLPAAVISLTWDVDADLDLQVIDPSRQVIEPKNPTTAPVMDDGTLPPGAGAIDRDSNAGCHIDSIRSENLVWLDEKPKGKYGIYVNMFDACKQPAANFRIAVYTRSSDGRSLHQWVEKEGELLDISANGGAARGLFVTEFVFK